MKKSAIGIYRTLQQVDEERTIYRIQAFLWIKWYKNGKKDITDDDSSGHLTTLCTDQNENNVTEIVRNGFW